MFAAVVLGTTAILLLSWFVIYCLVYLSGNLIIEGAHEPITLVKFKEIFWFCFFFSIALAIAGELGLTLDF
jgi:hypothetical protein